MAAGEFSVLVLGSAQDGGVPQIGCRCVNCQLALVTGKVRWSSSLAVTVAADAAAGGTQADTCDGSAAVHRILLDAGPDLRSQLRRFPGAVDAILLTHLHMGHYPGILEFGREVCGRQGLPVWCSPAVAAVLEANAPWAQLASQGHVVYRRFEPGAAFSPVPGLAVTAYPVPHRNEIGDTVAFAVLAASRTAGADEGGLLYLPDVDRWEGMSPTLPELVASVDVAVLDGTFFDHGELGRATGREIREVPHPPVEASLAMLGELATRVVFGHLNHTNPLLDPASAASRALAAQGARMAWEGQVFRIESGARGTPPPGRNG